MVTTVVFFFVNFRKKRGRDNRVKILSVDKEIKRE